jgi:hypothetical protein
MERGQSKARRAQMEALIARAKRLCELAAVTRAETARILQEAERLAASRPVKPSNKPPESGVLPFRPRRRSAA